MGASVSRSMPLAQKEGVFKKIVFPCISLRVFPKVALLPGYNTSCSLVGLDEAKNLENIFIIYEVNLSFLAK